jgi:ribosomal protein S27AE
VREVVAKDLDYKSAYELMLAKTREDSYSRGLAIVINEVAERLLDKERKCSRCSSTQFQAAPVNGGLCAKCWQHDNGSLDRLSEKC